MNRMLLEDELTIMRYCNLVALRNRLKGRVEG
jgi:hypothetical protein